MEGSGYSMLVGRYKQSGGIFHLEYNCPMKIEGPNIHFDDQTLERAMSVFYRIVGLDSRKSPAVQK